MILMGTVEILSSAIERKIFGGACTGVWREKNVCNYYTSDSPFISWISRSNIGDDHEAHCVLCYKGVSVASMEESALRAHT